MIKNIIIFIIFVLILSRCSYVRQNYFVNMCATSDFDTPICKCAFKVVDQEVSDQLGKTWVYRPDIARYPEIFEALDKADRQCESEMFRGN